MNTNSPGASATAGTWVDTAAQAVQSGFADAQQAAEKFWPATGAAVSKGLFGLGYGIGYAFAFPAVLVARVVPQENCVVWGLTDGAQVARERANPDTATS